MVHEVPRPGPRRGADQNSLGGVDSGSKNYILIDPPCSCHLRQPCEVCRAWWVHYQHTRLAAAAIRREEVRP
jgi:hypothetical protein